MRLAFIGVSHWHTPLYLDPALELAGSQVVGVSDPEPGAAQRIAARAAAAAFADYREMCDRLRPDFVFALGRHCDMADAARFLIERRIPFAIEKPCGLNAAEVTDIAAKARAANSFAAVPFVFRQSRMLETLREIAGGEPVHYLSFKFIAGSVERYRQSGCAWMLERRTAGGGAMLNLGVHFIDLARLLLGAGEPEVAGAMMSNAVDGLDTEDHGVVLLRNGGGACLIETGYIYPAAHMVFDMHFSIRTQRHHFAARDAESLEILDLAQRRELREIPMTNVPYYPAFVRDVIARAERGQRPIADLADMAAAMKLLAAAYAMAPLPAAS